MNYDKHEYNSGEIVFTSNVKRKYRMKRRRGERKNEREGREREEYGAT